MKAIGYQTAHTLAMLNERAELGLKDIELPVPEASGRDLLVAVHAVSVNPVDTKVRMRTSAVPEQWQVLGWDAAGEVVACGDAVEGFKPGDRVWYAGDISRPGSNAQYQLVDERITALMPRTLSFAAAAALPLTGLTAWELLFDRLEVPQQTRSTCQSLLVVGAAGGVGSVLVQLARCLTGLTVIATASRDETRTWLTELGADRLFNHKRSLCSEWQDAQIAEVDYVACLNNTDQHFADLVKLIKPQGKLGLIDDPHSLDINLLKRKSLSLHWEFMYTRPLFKTRDMQRQQHILTRLAELVDSGAVKTTATVNLGAINAANLRRAHEMVESHQTRGKIVLSGFA